MWLSPPPKTSADKLREAYRTKNHTYQKVRHVTIIPVPPRTESAMHGALSDESLGMMRIENYQALVDKLRLVHDIQSIAFAGDNVTSWGELGKALYYAHNHDIATSIFTDGRSYSEKIQPHLVKLDLTTYLREPDQRADIIEHIETYIRRGRHVILLYSFGADDPLEWLEEAAMLAKHYQLRCNLKPRFELHKANKGEPQPTQPFPFTSAFRERLLLAARLMRDELGQEKLPTFPIPFCLFSESELKEIRTKPGLTGTCSDCPMGQFTFYADGATVSPCALLPVTASLRHHLNLYELYETEMLPAMQRLQEIVPPKCTGCTHFKKKECFHGCLASRYYCEEHTPDTRTPPVNWENN